MSTSTKKKMKTKFFLILTVAVAFSSKRDHSDESSYGLYKLTKKKFSFQKSLILAKSHDMKCTDVAAKMRNKQ